MQILFAGTEARTSAVDRPTSAKHAGTLSNPSFGLIDLAEMPYLGQILPCYNYCSMRSRSPIIAFLVAPPFEVLDLAGPASVFIYAMVKDKPYYSFRILSTTSGDVVKSMGGLSIGATGRFSEYADPIDTLIVVGGLGSVEHPSLELLQWLRQRAARMRRGGSLST